MKERVTQINIGWATIHLTEDEIVVTVKLDLNNPKRLLSKVETNKNGSYTKIKQNKGFGFFEEKEKRG